MKKFTLLMLMLVFAGVTMAQTVEDFENIKMNLFSQGTNGAISVIPNPDPTGVNTSAYVCKMVIGVAGRDPWAGWYSTIAKAVDMSANKYVHLKIWKPRVSPTCFKLEKDGAMSGDTYPIADATETGKWVELVYDFTTNTNVSGEYVKIVLIPDFESPYTGTEDVTLYFDDIYVNNDPAVGSAPVSVIENFEPNVMNLFAGGSTGSLTVVDNPDKSGVNVSDRVCKMVRAKDGDPWQGWYGPVVPPVDVAATRYAHVKVWKPRVSPVCFKLEQGTGTPNVTGDIFSTPVQTVTNAWEDMVFDYGAFNGAFSQIVLIPDFENPLTLTEDFVMYFDDIIFNNDPNPIKAPEQKISVDMKDAGLVEGDRVFISGALGGIYGTWATPGDNPNNEMFDPENDKIFTVYLHLPADTYEFKFFKGTGWNGGDPANNRIAPFTSTSNLIFTWNVAGYVTQNKPLTAANEVKLFPNPVNNVMNINTTFDVKKVAITDMLGKVVRTYTTTGAGDRTIETENLSKGVYFVTLTGKNGDQVTRKIVKN